jgi:hypothetical protein
MMNRFSILRASYALRRAISNCPIGQASVAVLLALSAFLWTAFHPAPAELTPNVCPTTISIETVSNALQVCGGGADFY